MAGWVSYIDGTAISVRLDVSHQLEIQFLLVLFGSNFDKVERRPPDLSCARDEHAAVRCPEDLLAT